MRPELKIAFHDWLLREIAKYWTFTVSMVTGNYCQKCLKKETFDKEINIIEYKQVPK